MSRKQILFFILGGFFITNALVAEIVGGKLFVMPIPAFLQTFLGTLGILQTQFVVSVGLIPWPIVFVATDLVNEFFGRRGVRFYTYVTVGLILYSFIMLSLARFVPAVDFSPVSQAAFDNVFSTSQWIIVGSIIAFFVSQLVDVGVFSRVRQKTGAKYLWARATGSTVVSQLIDTFIVAGIAFYLPGKITLTQFLQMSTVSYIYKVFVAIAATPLCYLGHLVIRRYLGTFEAEKMAQEAAEQPPFTSFGVFG